MQARDLATKNVVTAQRFESIDVIARRMRDYHVGDIVIVEKDLEGDMPIGIVTDRDIVLDVVARGLSPVAVMAGEIMSYELITAHDSDDIGFVAELMQRNGIRRIPIIDRNLMLAGIVTMDDLLALREARGLDVIPHQQINWERAAHSHGPA